MDAFGDGSRLENLFPVRHEHFLFRALHGTIGRIGRPDSRQLSKRIASWTFQMAENEIMTGMRHEDRQVESLRQLTKSGIASTTMSASVSAVKACAHVTSDSRRRAPYFCFLTSSISA